MTHEKKESVSVIMPMRNAQTTVVSSLESVAKQNYPVKEIIVIDNASTDDSRTLVSSFSKTSPVRVRLYTRKTNRGIGSSFNFGVSKARSRFVVLMHSDCALSTKDELTKLMMPLLKDDSVVASYPAIHLPLSVWKQYGFWEKVFFSREVERDIRGLTGKFDVIRVESLKYIGGFDEVNFGVGGEDANMYDRLSAIGEVAESSARVTHLHYLGEGYTFSRLLAKHRAYARTYGRLIRVRNVSLARNGLILLAKPALAILPFVPPFQTIGSVFLIAYAFLVTRRMFMEKEVRRDYRILVLPFINVFILYFETFWMIESFLFGKNKIE